MEKIFYTGGITRAIVGCGAVAETRRFWSLAAARLPCPTTQAVVETGGVVAAISPSVEVLRLAIPRRESKVNCHRLNKRDRWVNCPA